MKLKGNPQEPKYNSILEEIYHRSHELMQACQELADDGRDAAHKRDALGRARAKAFLMAEGKNKEEREAKADAHYADERLDSFIADANKEACHEKVRSLRQTLSALQTIANSTKAEVDAFHYGQDGQT